MVGWLSSFTTVWFSSETRPLAARHPHKTQGKTFTPALNYCHYSTNTQYIFRSTGGENRRITTTLPDVGLFFICQKIKKIRNRGGSCFKILWKNEKPVAKPKAQPIIYNSLCMMDWHKTFSFSGVVCVYEYGGCFPPSSLSGAQTTFLGYQKGNIRRENFKPPSFLGCFGCVAVSVYSPIPPLQLFRFSSSLPPQVSRVQRPPSPSLLFMKNPQGYLFSLSLSSSIRCTHTTQTVPFNRLGADGWGMC